MLRKRLLASLALLLCATPSLALAAEAPAAATPTPPKSFKEMFGSGPQEEDVYRTDRLLVTATGSQKPVHLAPSVASVITADDIKAMGATTLDEALASVPGLHASSASAQYLAPTWSIRGLLTAVNPQVLLLINGVPFNNNFTGARGPGYLQMPVAMISRLEVVRGPGSALHGADAYSGVVNVITKDNFEIDGNVAGVRYGSFDTVDTWAQHGGQYGGWDLALGVEWQQTQGDDDRIIDRDYLHAIGQAPKSLAPGQLDTRRDLLDTHLNLRKQDWNLHLYGTLQESALGAGGFQVVTYGNDSDSKSLLADLNYHNDHQFTDWELNGRIYYSYIGIDPLIQFYPSTFLNMWGEPIYDTNDGGVEGSAVYKGFASHQLRVGIGAKNADFEPDQYKNFNLPAALGYKQCVPAAGNYSDQLTHITDPDCRYMPSANRNLWYGLAQDEWQFARSWTLTAGVRYDEYSDFGGTTNPRAALVWETTPELTTKLMYGQAFRAPSFSELYVTNNPVAIANPDVKPEEIQTTELAFDYQPTRDLRLLLNFFRYEATELVDLINLVYTNDREQEGQGFEVEMDWQALETVRLRGNFAYQRSENPETDTVIIDAPQTQAYLNPSWAFRPDWSIDGQFTWVGGRHRAEADPRDDIADYELVNLILRKKNIAKHWEAALSVRNLFDEDARIPSPYDAAMVAGARIPGDYPMESRAIWAEVSCHY